MLSSDETKSGGKPRKAKPAQDGDKAKLRKRKASAQVPKADQPMSAPEPAPVAAEAPVAPIDTAAPTAPADAPPVVPTAASEESTPIGYRALADAWGTYSRTSLEQTRSYFEKLAGVRSLGAAVEVQAEFAKQACETFVAQSLRI